MFGKDLKKIRSEKKITQQEVADFLGLKSAQFICNWERGISYPPPKMLKRLCVWLDIKYEHIAYQVVLEIIDTKKTKLRDKYKV